MAWDNCFWVFKMAVDEQGIVNCSCQTVCCIIVYNFLTSLNDSLFYLYHFSQFSCLCLLIRLNDLGQLMLQSDKVDAIII